MWPKILEKLPDATLDICYGWDLFLRAYSGNPERMMWKNQMDEKMKQKGITHHGRIGQSKMRDLRKTMDIWAYPTYFTEINCIGALECQNDGVVPCVINLAALKETVGSGIKVDGDIYSPEVREKYLKELLALCKDKQRIEKEREKGKKFVKDYTWAKRAKEWTKYMEL
jgi:glycosyltransferase involved in cell wall biosynthesis